MKFDIKKIFKGLLFLLILGFLGLYFAYSNGYHERLQNDKINLTNQMIEKFEKDLQTGKDVSIEDYLEEEKSYATKTGKTTLKIGQKVENIIDLGIKFIFKKIGNMVE